MTTTKLVAPATRFGTCTASSRSCARYTVAIAPPASFAAVPAPYAWYKRGVRGSLGLVIGVAIGAGAMYLVLRPPWAGGAHVSDAGAVALATHDAGAPHGKHHIYRHHGHRRPGAGGPLAGGDDPGWGDDQAPEQEAAPKLVQLSAADRAMEWRGDSTAKPPEKVDMAGGGEARSLSDSEIQDVIAGQSGPVQSCVVNAATNTDLHGTITVRMIVAGNGHVTRSKVEAPHYMFEHGLLACVQRAAAGLHFPAVGQSTLVTLPVNLTVN